MYSMAPFCVYQDLNSKLCAVLHSLSSSLWFSKGVALRRKTTTRYHYIVLIQWDNFQVYLSNYIFKASVSFQYVFTNLLFRRQIAIEMQVVIFFDTDIYISLLFLFLQNLKFQCYDITATWFITICDNKEGFFCSLDKLNYGCTQKQDVPTNKVCRLRFLTKTQYYYICS